MFNIIIKDVETGNALGAIKDTFTVPCEGEVLQIGGKQWEVVTSFYEPSLRGMSSNVHVVWVASTDRKNNKKKEKKSDNFLRFQLTSCMTAIVLVTVITLLVSFCKRVATNRNFVDNTIENIHSAVNHVDSVWKGGINDNTESNDSTQGVQ